MCGLGHVVEADDADVVPDPATGLVQARATPKAIWSFAAKIAVTDGSATSSRPAS